MSRSAAVGRLSPHQESEQAALGDRPGSAGPSRTTGPATAAPSCVSQLRRDEHATRSARVRWRDRRARPVLCLRSVRAHHVRDRLANGEGDSYRQVGAGAADTYRRGRLHRHPRLEGGRHRVTGLRETHPARGTKEPARRPAVIASRVTRSASNEGYSPST